MPTDIEQLREFLDAKVLLYNQPDFIPEDPISIPHRFQKQQDIEIAGLFAAVLAWGNRKTIINKCASLLEIMDNSPYHFILNHQENDLKALTEFKHRTFNATDTLYFVHFLKWFYHRHASLEEAFVAGMLPDATDVGGGLAHFHTLFCSLPEFPERSRKHVATPARGSACKRLNMYLRWMVRQDDTGVDFGLWKRLRPSQLICPCDIHVEQVAAKLGLLTQPKSNWKAAVTLTEQLRILDPQDPVKYDFALFGLGVVERFWQAPPPSYTPV
jgi:uncharacterized protein (TIGR02757 family)